MNTDTQIPQKGFIISLPSSPVPSLPFTPFSPYSPKPLPITLSGFQNFII